MINFSITDDILGPKRGSLLKGFAEEKEFSPFLVQRRLSMRDSWLSVVLNMTVNLFWKGLEDKRDMYKLFLVVVPKMPRRKIDYIKKVPKKSKTKANIDAVKILASRLELSQREVLEWYRFELINNTTLNKITGVKNDEKGKTSRTT